MMCTVLYRSGICPYWNVPVQMRGQYFVSQEKGREFEAGLYFVACPIDENSRLPFEKQCKEYRLMRCHNPDCELLKGFPKRIDTRTNHSL